MTSDAILHVDGAGEYDIQWSDTGDILFGATLDTAILMSVFGEVRASQSEVPKAKNRRGWVGNETNDDFEQGAKAWLFYQSRATASMFADLQSVVENAFEWMLEQDVADAYEVGLPRLMSGEITVPVTVSRDGSTDTQYYTLWDNTPYGG